jgi:hypothetical protein
MATAKTRTVYRATSVSSFLALIEKLKEVEVKSGNEADFIFRGQSEQNPLIPRIARLDPKGDLREVERLIMGDFKRQVLLFAEHEPRDEWDLLALAQHHRLPTRLLDWSYSALAALWFCVRKPPKMDKGRAVLDGEVWVFKTEATDFVDFETPGSPYSQAITRIFRPRFVSRRIMAQSGLFTCHKRLKSGHFVPLEKNTTYKRRLVKIEITGDKFLAIREQLWASGVTNLALFPDLDGLAGYLETRYFHDPKPAAKMRP